MRYENVALESIGYVLPGEVVTSDDIERQLAPLYQRLRLPEGRLELMSGIAERRFWPAGMPVSDQSVASGEQAIAAAGIDRGHIGALIHASVCRDHLEPATAASVHHRLQLDPRCLVYDVSNACLGLLNGALQIANMIQLGQVRAGLVVGTESCRQLVEHTIEVLNRDTSLTRRSIKSAVASLTIGSGSCAWLLTDRALSDGGSPLVAAVARANSEHHALCRSGADEAGAGMQPLMETDSERLMKEGIATGAVTFGELLRETGWTRPQLDCTFCHQVGSAHRQQMLESLELPADLDFATLHWLGNTGSVALPLTLALGARQGRVTAGHRAGLLGIGSGINCLMMGVQWQHTRVAGRDLADSAPAVPRPKASAARPAATPNESRAPGPGAS